MPLDNVPRTPDPVWDELIKAARARGLSYADLGRACNVTRATAFAWVNGGSEPTLATVRRLATVLGYHLVVLDPDEYEAWNEGLAAK